MRPPQELHTYQTVRSDEAVEDTILNTYSKDPEPKDEPLFEPPWTRPK